MSGTEKTAEKDPLEELSAEVQRYEPRRKQRYSTVNVLLLYWKDSDIPATRKEALELGALFRDHFKYFVLPYEIPSENSQQSLNFQVAEFLKQFAASDNLILVHYGGHGGKSPTRSPCTWAA